MPGTPHDALFKATFSRVEHAAAALRAILPAALLARLDLSTLALCPGSFVDRALASRHTDLLFSALLSARPALIYILFEHQSAPHRRMPLRLLGYMLRIWEAWLADHPEADRLPAILPVVLHHSETGWQSPVSFGDLLDVDPQTLAAIRNYVPCFQFVLEDISAETDDALRSRAMTALGRLVLWCLRHARSPLTLVDGLAGWLDLVREVHRAPDGAAALMMIWQYILAICTQLEPEELLQRLVEATEKEEVEMMSVADKLRERGRLAGLLEGQRAVLLKQLAARFGALPEAVVARVQNADATQLERWIERILTAPTLAEVLQQDDR